MQVASWEISGEVIWNKRIYANGHHCRFESCSDHNPPVRARSTERRVAGITMKHAVMFPTKVFCNGRCRGESLHHFLKVLFISITVLYSLILAWMRGLRCGCRLPAGSCLSGGFFKINHSRHKIIFMIGHDAFENEINLPDWLTMQGDLLYER